MRPPHPERVAEGCHWEAVEEDPKTWRAIPPDLSRPCRQRKDNHGAERSSCREPSVLAMKRGPANGQNWWHYCAGHTYGRWVETTESGLAVFSWRLTDDVPA